MSSTPNPTHLLHAISPTLLPALTHIINTSLLTGTFSTAFKQARVTPLLKKPTLNTSLIENYRPVSLLPFIAKALKRVVFNQVSLFLSQNSKLDASQSGFRSGHSTEAALLSVNETLWIAKADSKSSVLILLDLSAAFLTLSIIRSSCPPYHHCASLGLHFAGLNPISLVGLSRCPGEVRYPQHINWSLRFLAEPDFTKCNIFLGQHLCWPWNNIVINQSDLKNKFTMFVKCRLTISVCFLYSSVIHLSFSLILGITRGWG